LSANEEYTDSLRAAVSVLNDGGVIAYPTEHCFGLGCDPLDKHAVERILKIKRRAMSQGLILIAGNYDHVAVYADISQAAMLDSIHESWPGPTTWLLRKLESTPHWLSGEHKSIAMRHTAHRLSRELCLKFGGALVSTSANRHGQPALLTAKEVMDEMHQELDYIVDAPVGGAEAASKIRDAETGTQLR